MTTTLFVRVPGVFDGTLQVRDGEIIVASGASPNINVHLVGTSGLRKLGLGALTLNVENTVQGGALIDAGSLTINNGATLSSTFGLIATLSQSAVVTVNGAGSLWSVAGGLQLSGDNASSTLNILAGGTVSVGGDITGSLGSTTLTLDGGTLDMHNHSIGPLGQAIDNRNFRSGTLKNVQQINNGAGLNKTTAGTLTMDGTNTYTGPTTTRDGGLLVFKTSYLTGTGLNISGGSVQIAPSAVTPNNVVLKTPVFFNSTGKIDVTDNKLIVTNSFIGTASGAVYSGLSRQIQTGRNDGAWSGDGIVTSIPAAQTELTTLGIATGAQTGYAGGTFGGVSVAATDTLIMYTYSGDANLDGTINPDDYANISFNDNNPSASGYYNGDFNYDGDINADDFALIDFNFNAQGAPFPTGAAAFAAVPEPGGCALVGLAFTIARRRRAGGGIS